MPNREEDLMSGDELTRLRAEPDRERDLLAGPSGHSERLPHRPNGFRRCPVVHVRGQQLTRNSPEEFPASRAKGANLPGIKEFFDAMTGLVSTDERSDWDRGARWSQ